MNLAKTRLERCLQQPEHISLWHQHHPSDSLDLLELPQGPLLLAECFDWGLPRADQAAFGAAWANLFACLFGWREPQLTTTLWSWWQDAPQPRLKHLQLLAALPAEAPEHFRLEQHAFVSELLLAAAAVDRTSSDWLVAGLAAAVRRPLRPRAFGEPCPEDGALAAETQQLHDRLPPGHPARRLYATLRDQANAAIATAQQADRGLLEEVRKAIVTALAATGVTGGGIDLLGSVAVLHPPPPHPRVPCRHPNPHPHQAAAEQRPGAARTARINTTTTPPLARP